MIPDEIILTHGKEGVGKSNIKPKKSFTDKLKIGINRLAKVTEYAYNLMAAVGNTFVRTLVVLFIFTSIAKMMPEPLPEINLTTGHWFIIYCIACFCLQPMMSIYFELFKEFSFRLRKTIDNKEDETTN